MKYNSPKDCVLKVSSLLRQTYGNTLLDGNTDIKMAVRVVNALKNELGFYLPFDISRKEFVQKRKRVLKRECFEMNDNEIEHGWRELLKTKR